jgi:hypothetical protein
MSSRSNEVTAIASMMIQYGGSFVSRLGNALAAADSNDTRRIEKAFPEYWDNYRQMAIDADLIDDEKEVMSSP